MVRRASYRIIRTWVSEIWETVIKKMKSKGGGKDSPSLFAGLMQELQPMVGIASPEGKSTFSDLLAFKWS